MLENEAVYGFIPNSQAQPLLSALTKMQELFSDDSMTLRKNWSCSTLVFSLCVVVQTG